MKCREPRCGGDRCLAPVGTDDSYKLDIKLEESNAIVTGVARVTRPKLGIENYVDEIAHISGKEEIIGKVVDEIVDRQVPWNDRERQVRMTGARHLSATCTQRNAPLRRSNSVWSFKTDLQAS